MRFTGFAALVYLLSTAPAPAQLTGTATLSGKVLSAQTNAPIAKATVTLTLEATASATAVVHTDTAGDFSLDKLSAGDYRVSSIRTGFRFMYYGNGSTPQPGAFIRLEEGTHKSGVAIRLPLNSSIIGLLVDSDGDPIVSTSVGLYRLITRDGRPGSQMQGGAQSDERGAFALNSIPEGSYTIKASSDSPEPGYYAQQPVQVGTEPISGLEIPVRESVDIAVTLTVEPAIQSQSASQALAFRLNRFMVQPITFGPNTINPRLQKIEDGKFEIQKLTPGKYRLMSPSGGYIKSIKWSDCESSGSILDVTGAESGPIQVTIGPNYARASGTVQDFREGIKLTVALIPEDDERLDFRSIVMGTVTPSGQFQAQGAPGVHFAFCMKSAGMQQVLYPAILPIAKREIIEQTFNGYMAKGGR